MALFTDGAANGLEQLLAHDSGVLETARIECIDLATKLRLAWEELGIELKRYLVLRGREELDLTHVVVTEPLRKCHAFRTLALAYRDAANLQRNDRYRERWKDWEKQAAWAWEALLDTGVGIVERPVPRAELPKVELVEVEAPAASYCVQVTWLNAEGDEGAPSDIVLASASAGQGLLVITSEPPEGVVGWNVYVGHESTDMKRQNATPLGRGETWRQAGPDLAIGPQPGQGQMADYYLRRAAGPSGRWRGTWTDAPGVLWRG